jgi:predicted transcriptional regulator
MASSDKKTVKHLELSKNSEPQIEIVCKSKPVKGNEESKKYCHPDRRSKLTLYFDILGVLENGIRMGSIQILQKANIRNPPMNIQYLDFLAKQNLITKTVDKYTTAYSITQKGLTVLKYFSKTSAFFSFDKNSQGAT